MKAEQIKEKARKKEGNLQSIRIDEWDADIRFRPVTIADQQHIRQKFKDLVDDQLAISIELVMLKCLDEEGKRIFTTEEDRTFLRNEAASKTIERIIWAIQGIDLQSAKKNSQKTDS